MKIRVDTPSGVRKGRKKQHVDAPRADYARIEFVATPEQKRRWDTSAKAMGVSLSAWLVLAADAQEQRLCA